MITHETNRNYHACEERYKGMTYSRCGNSGVRLPKLSLGLWQNFGDYDSYDNARAMLQTAFDLGINHFDLANNYGPPYGTAEKTFGGIFKQDFLPYRDELFISSKAGYDMWPGPFGIGGSRKYLVASCDQSLKRTGLEYFDVFYHHCMDSETPIEESMQALDYIVRSGRALYVGVSNYGAKQTKQAIDILNDLGTPLLIHQPKYNLFERSLEGELSDVLLDKQVGSVVYSPLAQGILTEKYIAGIPENSRAARQEIIHLNESQILDQTRQTVVKLNELAQQRGQTLAQMAIAWTLNNKAVTSCLVGASREEQIVDCYRALDQLVFSPQELEQIDNILAAH